MIKNFAGAALIAAVVAGGTSFVNAQSGAPAPTVAFVPSQTTGEILSSSLIGEKVRNGAKEDLGDINDLVFDGDGRVASAVIGVGGFLGIGEKNVAVPFAVLSRETDEGGKSYIRIDTTREQLKAAPLYQRLDKGVGVTEKIKEWGVKARDKAVEYGEKAKDKAAEYGEKAKEAYGNAKDRVTGDPAAPKQPQ